MLDSKQIPRFIVYSQSGIPVTEQSISYEGRDLGDPKATMRACGIGENAILLLRRKVQVAGRQAPPRALDHIY